MAKPVDMKHQQRFALDVILGSIAVNGVIYAGNLNRAWNSLKGIINPKRLKYFLKQTGTKMHSRAVEFLTRVNKAIARTIQQEPELLAS